MPVLKTPGGRGRLGSAGVGAADGAMDFLDYFMKKKLMDKQNDLVSNREVRLKKMGQDYEDKKQAKLDLEKVPAFIGKISPDMTDSQIQSGLDVAGADTTPRFGQMAQQEEEGSLPSTQFGPVASLPWEHATQARKESIDSLLAKNARDNQQKYEGQYAKTAGKADAVNANAEEALRQEVDKETQVGGVKATNAGLTTGAQQDALNDPARQKAHARGAGMNAAADAGTKQPFEMAKMREQEAIRSAGLKETEKWKLDNTVTGSTKTMMEGARMILPRIDDVAKEARVLDQAGLFGPVMSRVRQIAVKAGSVEELEGLIQNDPEIRGMDPLAGRFAAEAGLMASGVGRVHGGARGGGSIQMVNYMKGLLSDSATADMFLGRLEGVKSYMEDYAAGPNAEPKSHFDPAEHGVKLVEPGAAPAANPADRFLKRAGR